MTCRAPSCVNRCIGSRWQKTWSTHSGEGVNHFEEGVNHGEEGRRDLEHTQWEGVNHCEEGE